MKEKILYSVTVRDELGKLYKDSKGNTVTDFKVRSIRIPVESIKIYCEELHRCYKAIAKEGSSVEISVQTFNNISGTYMGMHSLYDYKDHTKFVSH